MTKNLFYEADFPSFFIYGGNNHIKSRVLDSYPIHDACARGAVWEVVSLIASGVNVNSIADMGQTPLHIAVDARQAEIVGLLLLNGANIDSLNEFGKTPLDIANHKKYYEIINIFKNSNENKNHNNKKNKYIFELYDKESIHFDALNGDIEKIKIKLNYGLFIDTKTNDGWELSSLHIAVGMGNIDLVKFLLSEGADPLLENGPGYNSIDISMYVGRQDLIYYIYSFSRNRDSVNWNQSNPFYKKPF